MAMRQTPRSGGGSTQRRPPRPPVIVQPVHEDFWPTIKWQEDKESNSLLLIHLQGLFFFNLFN